MTDIGEIALYFIYIRDQLKIYHWQTKNYARHVASDSFVSSSESLVESSSDETPALDKQSKSLSPPVMKTKTKKSDLREAYKANASSSSRRNSSIKWSI